MTAAERSDCKRISGLLVGRDEPRATTGIRARESQSLRSGLEGHLCSRLPRTGPTCSAVVDLTVQSWVGAFFVRER